MRTSTLPLVLGTITQPTTNNINGIASLDIVLQCVTLISLHRGADETIAENFHVVPSLALVYATRIASKYHCRKVAFDILFLHCSLTVFPLAQ